MGNDDKIIFKRSALLGNDIYHNDVMKALKKANGSNSIFRRSDRTKQIFEDLKCAREGGGVTRGEMKRILADSKYGRRYNREGINEIAKAFDLGHIEKKHQSPKVKEIQKNISDQQNLSPQRTMAKPLSKTRDVQTDRGMRTSMGTASPHFGGSPVSFMGKR